MRCRACNRELSDYESTRKNPDTGEYEDICNQCRAGYLRWAIYCPYNTDDVELINTVRYKPRTQTRSTE